MIGKPWALGWVGLLLASVAGTAGPVAPGPSYRVVRELPVGGEGGWDYLLVDASTRRLYVSHSTEVVVLDADSGQRLGAIPKLAGVHGVALAPEIGRGFISNGRSGAITIFDPKTLAVLGEVQSTGENPDAILYDPPSGRVFAFNHSSGNVTVIEAASGKVAGTIAVGGTLEFGVSDLAGRIFVNVEDRSQIVALSARDLAVTARWPLAPCEEPTGLAIDRAHHRLLAVCGNRLAAVVDAESGKVVATVPIGELVDGAAFDGERGLGFSSNGEGTMTVIRQESPDRYRVLETVPTRRGARTIALDEKTHALYLPTAKLGPTPASTAAQPRARPTAEPGTFAVLVVNR